MEKDGLLKRAHRFVFGEYLPVVIPDITLKEGILPFDPKNFDPLLYPEQQGDYIGGYSHWGDGVGIGDVVDIGGKKLRFLGRDEETGKYFYKVVPIEQPPK